MSKMKMSDFSENTLRELKGMRRNVEKQLKLSSQEIEKCHTLIGHFDALLGVPQCKKDNGEKSDSSTWIEKAVEKLARPFERRTK
jgi:hypothetical protein